MLKFATAQIIAASLGDQQHFTKAAHRAVFTYDARPGFLYVRSRAISSRCNDNWDEFPADEIAKGYQTFIGKPVFVNHKNDNHRRARGVIIDAALHEDKNPDGSRDTWAEVLMEIDAKQFPKLARAILAGHIDRTSMGCDVERSVCSACGNEATTPAEYCAHIPGLKGKRIFRHTASGQRVGELVRETCYGLSFFENSVLVEPPADPTAHFLGVDASGLGKAASKNAAIDFSEFDHDGLEDEDDEEDKPYTPSVNAPHPPPAAPQSHVPGEGTARDPQRRRDVITQTRPYIPLKPSLNGLQAAARPAKPPAQELDEYGTPKPKRGQPYEPAGEHPWYKQVPLHHDNVVAHWDKATPEEKDSGMRWYGDAHHVAKAIAKLHPGITSDEEAAHKGAGVLSAYSPRTNWPQNMFNAAHSFARGAAVRPLKDDPDKPEHVITMGMHADKAQRIMDGEHHQPVLNSPKTQDFAHLIEHGGYEPQTDEEKASGAPRRMSGRVVVDRHALSVAAGRRITDVENDAHQGFPGAQSGKHARHYYEHAANTYRNAAAAISEKEGKPVGAHQVQAVTWLVRQRLNGEEDRANANAKARNLGKGRSSGEEKIKGYWKDFAGEHTPQLKDDGNSHLARLVGADEILEDGTIRTLAYGEIKAPQDVDTLREENCPVCGDKDTYDGQACQICGFISPPNQFRDPDLDMAKRLDLRKQVVDPTLVDDNGELQRVDQDGNAIPKDPNADPDDPDAQGDPDDPNAQMIDPDQVDENGLPQSPYGDQALDGTQQGPAVSDRDGDGMIQPDEIDMDGNANLQQDQVEPGMGGQAAPRELPYWGQDHTGDFFTPGPDMPMRPNEPDKPLGPEGLSDEDKSGMPVPGSPGVPGTPGDGVPDLMCGNCGFAADATPPQTQNMANPMEATDGVVDGDVCPSCQRGQLLTPGEINSNYSKAPAVERPAYS
ncbi:hypothetical protein ACH4S8_37740 [Streptomyces sp. NPDC021080]|uniref:DUF7178 family protein n=1 Tax=Streptomyces sp. NPDC021080 TaxID=3365110 RepID=UPI0037B10B5E